MISEWAARNPRIIPIGFVRGGDIPAYTCAADVVYYGFDPANPNARYSAPNKLFEALAAGRLLITGDFGEIAEVVKTAGCGIVLGEYRVDEIRRALESLADAELRKFMAERAREYGRAVMNWEKGEAVLHRQYSELLPSGLAWPPSRSGSRPLATAAGVRESGRQG